MKKALFLFALVLYVGYMSLAVFSVSHAQDADTPQPEVTEVAPVPVEPTALATVEPTPAPQQPPVDTPAPSDRTVYVIGFIVFAVFSLIINYLQNRNAGALIEGLKAALDNKQLQDEARERYMQSSLSTQEIMKMLESGLRLLSAANLPVVDPLIDKAAEFGDKVITPSSASVN